MCQDHPSDNLLKSETYRKWQCADPGEKQASVIIEVMFCLIDLFCDRYSHDILINISSSKRHLKSIHWILVSIAVALSDCSAFYH